MGEKRDLFFTVVNRNPVPVTLRGWGSNLTGSLVEMMGVAPGDEEDIAVRTNYSEGLHRRLVIPPGHYMVFRIGLMTKDLEGEHNASVFVDTDFHAFHVYFRFKVAKGSVTTMPKDLAFEHAFPVSD